MSEPEAETLPVIEFVAPMPGFPDNRRFMLVRVDDDGLLYAMTSLDTRGLRFLVAPPAPFFPSYAPEIDDETLGALGTAEATDLLVLLVIAAGTSARDATANLMAPIVFDQTTRRATQLVLVGSGLSVREPLLVARS
ncbi:MAG: flagellar assembly protein FliW [Dactylosporangium sp.]|nr:flagellar assembly protein FliW [Dactylosporangium sp.]